MSFGVLDIKEIQKFIGGDLGISENLLKEIINSLLKTLGDCHFEVNPKLSAINLAVDKFDFQLNDLNLKLKELGDIGLKLNGLDLDGILGSLDVLRNLNLYIDPQLLPSIKTKLNLFFNIDIELKCLQDNISYLKKNNSLAGDNDFNFLMNSLSNFDNFIISISKLAKVTQIVDDLNSLKSSNIRIPEIKLKSENDIGDDKFKEFNILKRELNKLKEIKPIIDSINESELSNVFKNISNELPSISKNELNEIANTLPKFQNWLGEWIKWSPKLRLLNIQFPCINFNPLITFGKISNFIKLGVLKDLDILFNLSKINLSLDKLRNFNLNLNTVLPSLNLPELDLRIGELDIAIKSLPDIDFLKKLQIDLPKIDLEYKNNIEKYYKDLKLPEYAGLKSIEKTTISSIFESLKPYVELVRLIFYLIAIIEDIVARIGGLTNPAYDEKSITYSLPKLGGIFSQIDLGIPKFEIDANIDCFNLDINFKKKPVEKSQINFELGKKELDLNNPEIKGKIPENGEGNKPKKIYLGLLEGDKFIKPNDDKLMVDGSYYQFDIIQNPSQLKIKRELQIEEKYKNDEFFKTEIDTLKSNIIENDEFNTLVKETQLKKLKKNNLISLLDTAYIDYVEVKINDKDTIINPDIDYDLFYNDVSEGRLVYGILKNDKENEDSRGPRTYAAPYWKFTAPFIFTSKLMPIIKEALKLIGETLELVSNPTKIFEFLFKIILKKISEHFPVLDINFDWSNKLYDCIKGKLFIDKLKGIIPPELYNDFNLNFDKLKGLGDLSPDLLLKLKNIDLPQIELLKSIPKIDLDFIIKIPKPILDLIIKFPQINFSLFKPLLNLGLPKINELKFNFINIPNYELNLSLPKINFDWKLFKEISIFNFDWNYLFNIDLDILNKVNLNYDLPNLNLDLFKDFNIDLIFSLDFNLLKKIPLDIFKQINFNNPLENLKFTLDGFGLTLAPFPMLIDFNLFKLDINFKLPTDKDFDLYKKAYFEKIGFDDPFNQQIQNIQNLPQIPELPTIPNIPQFPSIPNIPDTSDIDRIKNFDYPQLPNFTIPQIKLPELPNINLPKLPELPDISIQPVFSLITNLIQIPIEFIKMVFELALKLIKGFLKVWELPKLIVDFITFKWLTDLLSFENILKFAGMEINFDDLSKLKIPFFNFPPIKAPNIDVKILREINLLLTFDNLLKGLFGMIEGFLNIFLQMPTKLIGLPDLPKLEFLTKLNLGKLNCKQIEKILNLQNIKKFNEQLINYNNNLTTNINNSLNISNEQLNEFNKSEFNDIKNDDKLNKINLDKLSNLNNVLSKELLNIFNNFNIKDGLNELKLEQFLNFTIDKEFRNFATIPKDILNNLTFKDMGKDNNISSPYNNIIKNFKRPELVNNSNFDNYNIGDFLSVLNKLKFNKALIKNAKLDVLSLGELKDIISTPNIETKLEKINNLNIQNKSINLNDLNNKINQKNKIEQIISNNKSLLNGINNDTIKVDEFFKQNKTDILSLGLDIPKQFSNICDGELPDLKALNLNIPLPKCKDIATLIK